MSALLAPFRWLKTNLIAFLSLLLAGAVLMLSRMSRRNQKLKDRVNHHEAREEADEFRSKPVVHDKSDILDRM